MKAHWNGKILAESEKTIEVGGYPYFPRDRVRMEMLRRAAKTPHDHECPHGVQFYAAFAKPAFAIVCDGLSPAFDQNLTKSAAPVGQYTNAAGIESSGRSRANVQHSPEAARQRDDVPGRCPGCPPR